jgi:hypothetical protein
MSKANVKLASLGGGRKTMSSRPSAERIPDAADRLAADWDVSSGKKGGSALDARAHLKGRLALPVPEVAELLGISSAAVRLMIARGEFPGRKIGGGTERVTYIVPTGALLGWLDGTARVAPEEGAV